MKDNLKLARALSIAQKEVKHILRDPFTLAFALGIPVILLTFFGYIIDFNYRNLIIAVEDRDNTSISRQLTETFSASGFFKLMTPTPGKRLANELDSERISGLIVIEPGFYKKIKKNEEAEIQLIVDGTDNTKSGVLLGYINDIQQIASKKLFNPALSEKLFRKGWVNAKTYNPVEIKTRFLFNPELNSRWFIIPGLTVVLIGLLSIFLTALTVAREWENGSMELLLSTPVKRSEIVIGKLAPYLVLTFLGVIFIYLISRIVFEIPFEGNHFLYGITCIIFITAALSQGLLISVITRQQQLAMQLSFVTGLLPSLLLSGFIFPIESMPKFFQYFTAILPQRWFITISRGIFLKGAGLFDLIKPLSILLLMDFLLITAAVKNFKRDLEP